MLRIRGPAFAFATLIVFASGMAALPLLGDDSITLNGLQPPYGTVHGPVGSFVDGKFDGPKVNPRNSIKATVRYTLETADTGQVYVGVFDEALQSRRILGVINIRKGSRGAGVEFTLACTPGAPATTLVQTIEIGINRLGPPPPTAAPLPPIHATNKVRYEFACPVKQ